MDLSQHRLQRVMNLNILAAVGAVMWFSVVGPNPLFNVFFMNHLHATSRELGALLAILQLSALANLAAVVIYDRLRGRKVFWITCHIIHRTFGIILAGVSLYAAGHGVNHSLIKVVYLSMSLSWLLMNLSASGWWSWTADLIPEKIRATFFGRRSSILNIVNIVWFFMAAAALDIGKRSFFYIFACIALISGLAGIADIVLYIKMPEEPKKKPLEKFDIKRVIAPLKNRNFVVFSVTAGLAIFSMNVFGPFSSPYITSPAAIGAPNSWLGIMFVISQLTWSLLAGPWGMIMDRYGRKPAVILSLLFSGGWLGFLFLTPGNYTFILPVIALTGGLLGSAFGEAVNQLMLTLTHEENRTTYVAWYMVIIGLVSAGGSLLGGIINDGLSGWEVTIAAGLKLHGIHIVLIFSLVLIAVSALLLTRIREGSEKPVGFVISRLARPGVFRAFLNIGILSRTEESGKAARVLRSIDDGADDITLDDVFGRLHDPDEEVREEAARALGRLKNPNAVDLLIGELKDPLSTIRIDAARALGRIGDKSALPALIEGLNESDESIRQACAYALGLFGGGNETSRPLVDLIKNRGSDASDRLIATSAVSASQMGALEAAREIIILMHTTGNRVLQKQLSIATANLLGRPGVFYRYITGSSQSRTAQRRKLFQDALRSLEHFVDRTRIEPLEKSLQIVQEELNEERPEESLRELIRLGRNLVGVVTGTASPDDNVVSAAYERDPRFGIWIWFLFDAFRRIRRLSLQVMKTDVLLGTYFLADSSMRGGKKNLES